MNRCEWVCTLVTASRWLGCCCGVGGCCAGCRLRSDRARRQMGMSVGRGGMKAGNSGAHQPVRAGPEKVAA